MEFGTGSSRSAIARSIAIGMADSSFGIPSDLDSRIRKTVHNARKGAIVRRFAENGEHG